MGERKNGLVHLSRFWGCGKEVFRSHFPGLERKNHCNLQCFCCGASCDGAEGGGQENQGNYMKLRGFSEHVEKLKVFGRGRSAWR